MDTLFELMKKDEPLNSELAACITQAAGMLVRASG